MSLPISSGQQPEASVALKLLMCSRYLCLRVSVRRVFVRRQRRTFFFETKVIVGKNFDLKA